MNKLGKRVEALEESGQHTAPKLIVIEPGESSLGYEAEHGPLAAGPANVLMICTGVPRGESGWCR